MSVGYMRSKSWSPGSSRQQFTPFISFFRLQLIAGLLFIMNNKHNAGLRSTFNTKPEPTEQSSIRDIQDCEIDRNGN